MIGPTCGIRSSPSLNCFDPRVLKHVGHAFIDSVTMWHWTPAHCNSGWNWAKWLLHFCNALLFNCLSFVCLALFPFLVLCRVALCLDVVCVGSLHKPFTTSQGAYTTNQTTYNITVKYPVGTFKSVKLIKEVDHTGKWMASASVQDNLG